MRPGRPYLDLALIGNRLAVYGGQRYRVPWEAVERLMATARAHPRGNFPVGPSSESQGDSSWDAC